MKSIWKSFESVKLAIDPTALPARQAVLMATRLGAEAMHMGHLTGSLEPGKRADLILVDLSPVHNVPSFSRDPQVPYAQLVYAAKSTDVADVMCNGRWLMRERRLLTLDEDSLRASAREYARRIDASLIEREGSVLRKLVDIGGAVEQESFEVQVKARIGSADPVLAALEGPSVTIIKTARYHQYDTWFLFDDPSQGRLRYREDEFLDERGASTRPELPTGNPPGPASFSVE